MKSERKVRIHMGRDRLGFMRGSSGKEVMCIFSLAKEDTNGGGLNFDTNKI